MLWREHPISYEESSRLLRECEGGQELMVQIWPKIMLHALEVSFVSHGGSCFVSYKCLKYSYLHHLHLNHGHLTVGTHLSQSSSRLKQYCMSLNVRLAGQNIALSRPPLRQYAIAMLPVCARTAEIAGLSLYPQVFTNMRMNSTCPLMPPEA